MRPLLLLPTFSFCTQTGIDDEDLCSSGSKDICYDSEVPNYSVTLLQGSLTRRGRLKNSTLDSIGSSNAHSFAKTALNSTVIHMLSGEHDPRVLLHGWPVSPDDRLKINSYLLPLLQEKADVNWTWRYENTSWTFGAENAGAEAPVKELTRHLLHHHGLAALVAANAGLVIPSSKGDNALYKLHDVLNAENDLPEVQHVQRVLNSLTLTGLRNLHSFDHQGRWSSDKNHRNIRNLADGIVYDLQAAWSNRLQYFMGKYHLADARHDARKALSSIPAQIEGIENISFFEDNFLNVFTAGGILHVIEAKLRHAPGNDVNSCYLEFVARWTGIASTVADYPVCCLEIRPAECLTLVSAEEGFQFAAAVYVHDWYQLRLRIFRTFVGSYSHLTSAFELADFAWAAQLLDTSF